MPITPFHFGLGAALTAVAPRQCSFLSFCAVNVLIDIESLHNMREGNFPVHAFFHTYPGASLLAGLTVLLFLLARWCASRIRLPNFYRWQQLTVLQVSGGAISGAWSHVFLDSIMHADILPLHPYSDANILYEIIPLTYLHLALVALAVLGAIGVTLRGADA